MSNFSWLHLTDLHQGMATQDWLWPNVREVFHEDLGKLHDACGPWHVGFLHNGRTVGHLFQASPSS